MGLKYAYLTNDHETEKQRNKGHLGNTIKGNYSEKKLQNDLKLGEDSGDKNTT